MADKVENSKDEIATNDTLKDNNPVKAGFVALIGLPNTGKSTLLNALVGTKLSIVTAKAQTTRKNVMGILTDERTQIIFQDTPGLLSPRYKLQEKMMDYVATTLSETDIVCVLFDSHTLCQGDYTTYEKVVERIGSIAKPKFAILNKIDLLKSTKELFPVIAKIAENNLFEEIIPISSLKRVSLDNLLNTIRKYLPDGEYYYDPEEIGTQSQRFFVSEIIRETVFEVLSNEVPYTVEVVINEFKERDNKDIYISADLVTERTSQKKIIIGENGRMIKKLGEKSRKKIEEFLDCSIYLEIFVKVRANWRKKDVFLKSFGY